MQEQGIIYLPDFLINSGGLIHVAATFANKSDTIADEKVNQIYDATLTMLERAAMSGDTTTLTAEKIAIEKLY
jgi:leucine dehydrogenase